MGPDLGPGAQIWGAPGPGPFFSARIFLETRARILTRPTFKKKLPLQASRPFPEGAPRKVSMFKFYFPGRSSDMSISCPATVFSPHNGKNQDEEISKILTFQDDSAIPRFLHAKNSFLHAKTPASWVPICLGGCGRLPPAVLFSENRALGPIGPRAYWP